MVIKEFMILSASSVFLIVLIGTIVFSFFLDVSITGKVVNVEPHKNIPSGFDLAVPLIITTIIILFILNMNLKILAKLLWRKTRK